jgi:hypothetical protein
MSSDVAENLPSAPSTPTISVTSISDLTSTFEAVSMGSISEQETGTRTFTRDSRFDFDKQRIIAVRVRADSIHDVQQVTDCLILGTRC